MRQSEFFGLNLRELLRYKPDQCLDIETGRQSICYHEESESMMSQGRYIKKEPIYSLVKLSRVPVLETSNEHMQNVIGIAVEQPFHSPGSNRKVIPAFGVLAYWNQLIWPEHYENEGLFVSMQFDLGKERLSDIHVANVFSERLEKLRERGSIIHLANLNPNNPHLEEKIPSIEEMVSLFYKSIFSRTN